MKQKLEKLLEKAYCRYSNFPVSAISVWSDGSEVEGVNVENCAFPSGICAERTSIVTAITQGKGNHEIKELHLMTDTDSYPSCCGACRQVIAEFAADDLKIIYHRKGREGMIREDFFTKVLPRAFTPKDLVNGKF